MHVIKIIFGSGLAFLLFPFVCAIGVICDLQMQSVYPFDEGMILAGFIAAFSLTHLTLFWKRLQTYGYASRLRIPALFAAIAIMCRNRHVESWVDDSPFASSITLYDQQIIGLCGYLRVFDVPNEKYGWLELDLAGLFFNVEFLVFAIFVFAAFLTLYDILAASIWKKPTLTDLPEHINPPGVTAGSPSSDTRAS